jgi:hypothetical protein
MNHRPTLAAEARRKLHPKHQPRHQQHAQNLICLSAKTKMRKCERR